MGIGRAKKQFYEQYEKQPTLTRRLYKAPRIHRTKATK